MNGELILTSDTYDQGRVAINDSFSGTAYLNNLSLDTDFSGGTGGGVIYSAGTDLYNIFLTAAVASDVTRVQNGTNTFTGGTGNNPTVNITGGTLNNLNITGGTLSSGGTDLYNIFCTDCSSGGTGFSGFSSSTGTFSIIENNGSGNIASEFYGYAGGNGAISSNYGEWSRTSGNLGQYGAMSWYGSTTLAPGNISQIFLDGGSSNKLFVVPLDSSYYVNFTIVARIIGGLADGDSATWKADGMAVNIGGVVSVPIDMGGNQFLPTGVVLDTSFLAGPTVVISAETATSALTVTVIGPDDNVDWFVTGRFEKVI